MKKLWKTGQGFTLVETLIVMFIFGTIIGMPMLFLYGIGRSNQLTATAREVVAVLNETQTSAINGKSVDGAQPSSYGIYFQPSYYVLFAGSSYSAADSHNQRTDLPSGVTFSQIQVPASQIVFDKVTGQVISFDPSQNFVVLRESNSNETRQITVSKVGSITF